jgi:ADP-ribose pyrophosphatase
MLISRQHIHAGRVIRVGQELVQFPDGSTGTLDMVRHPGAAAIVPMLDLLSDPDPQVILVRQFRHAADGFIWEIPAGTLGPDETPDDCARRELREEAGYSAGRLDYLTSILTAPGFTDESIHLYLATGLLPSETHRDQDEFMTVHEFAWSAIGRMIRNRDIRDGKSLAALMFVNSFLRA